MPIPNLQVTVAPPAPPAPTVPPAAVQGPSIADLQTQAQSLTDQLTVLVGQSRGLVAQLRGQHGEARASTAAALRDVGAQISDVTGQLANVRAQLAFRQSPAEGRGTRTGMPPFPPGFGTAPRPFDPDLVAGLMFAIIFAVLMPISIGYSRRLWRRGAATPQPPQADHISPRLERLEQAVDAVAIEIERISEGQRFVTKVLTERPTESRNPSGTESRDSAGNGEAKPFRAIGAGAMEPIRAPERHAVRQSNTPH